MRYRRLGHQTFLAILLDRTSIFYFFAFIYGLALIASEAVPYEARKAIYLAMPWMLVSAAVLLASGFAIGILEYASYKITLRPKGIEIARGFGRAMLVPYAGILGYRLRQNWLEKKIHIRTIELLVRDARGRCFVVAIPHLSFEIADRLKFVLAHERKNIETGLAFR